MELGCIVHSSFVQTVIIELIPLARHGVLIFMERALQPHGGRSNDCSGTLTDKRPVNVNGSLMRTGRSTNDMQSRNMLLAARDSTS